MLTLYPQTTRIMSINNNNNMNQQHSKAPHSPTRLIGDPAARQHRERQENS